MVWDALSNALVSFAVGVVELFPTSPFVILDQIVQLGALRVAANGELVRPGQYLRGYPGILAILRGDLLRVPGCSALGEGD